MTPFENLDNLTELNVLFGKQDKEMIHQIRCLTEEKRFVVILALNYQFHGFLTDFLCYLVQTATEQVVGIGTFLGIFPPVIDHLLQIEQEFTGGYLGRVVRLIEAGIAASMAYRTGRYCLDQQGIVVAILDNLANLQVIAAGLPLCP